MTDYRIELAPQDRVHRLAAEIDRVLEALGHPEALVTDESLLWDFNLEPDELRELGEALGVAVAKDDYIVEIAERLRGVA